MGKAQDVVDHRRCDRCFDEIAYQHKILALWGYHIIKMSSVGGELDEVLETDR